MCIHTYTHILTRTHAHTHTRTKAHTYKQTYTHTHNHTHAHAHAHPHPHTHTHTHTHVSTRLHASCIHVIYTNIFIYNTPLYTYTYSIYIYTYIYTAYVHDTNYNLSKNSIETWEYGLFGDRMSNNVFRSGLVLIKQPVKLATSENAWPRITLAINW